MSVTLVKEAEVKLLASPRTAVLLPGRAHLACVANGGVFVCDLGGAITKWLRRATSRAPGRIAIVGRRLFAQTGWHLRTWSIPSWKESITFDFDEKYCSVQSISIDGMRVLTRSYHPRNKTFTVWDVTKKRVLATFTEKKSFVIGVTLSSDGRVVVHGGTDGVVRFFDVARGEHFARVRGKGWIDVAARSDDGRFFATGTRLGFVHVWSADATLLHTLRLGARVEGIEISPDGQMLLAHGTKGAPIAWDLPSGERLFTIDVHATSGMFGGVRSVRFSQDGTRVVTMGNDSRACVFRIER